MTEYLAPGVYLEESDAGVKPIPGVSTSTIDIETARALVAAIESIVERTQPDWTRSNDADPGITQGCVHGPGAAKHANADLEVRAR